MRTDASGQSRSVVSTREAMSSRVAPAAISLLTRSITVFELSTERPDIVLGQDRTVTGDHGAEVEGQQAGQRGRPFRGAATVTEIPER